MTCREYRLEWMEWARAGIEPRTCSHLDACDECAVWLERQLALTGVAAQLRDEHVTLPSSIEASLLEEFDRLQRRTVAGRRLRAAALLATAASVGAISWLSTRPHHVAPQHPTVAENAPAEVAGVPKRVPDVRQTQQPKAGSAGQHRRVQRRAEIPRTESPREDDPPFIAVPYTEPLAPYEQASVRRMELPITALTAIGFAMDAADPRASVLADVLVGEDGRARAFRLISVSRR